MKGLSHGMEAKYLSHKCFIFLVPNPMLSIVEFMKQLRPNPCSEVSKILWHGRHIWNNKNKNVTDIHGAMSADTAETLYRHRVPANGQRLGKRRDIRTRETPQSSPTVLNSLLQGTFHRLPHLKYSLLQINIRIPFFPCLTLFGESI